MIWVSDDDADFDFTVFKNGATTPVTETQTASSYLRHIAFGAIFGGFFNESNGFNTTFKGILHTAFLKDAILSPAQIQNWLFPRTSGSQLWNYFIKPTPNPIDSLNLVETITPNPDGVPVMEGSGLALPHGRVGPAKSGTMHMWFKGEIVQDKDIACFIASNIELIWAGKLAGKLFYYFKFTYPWVNP